MKESKDFILFQKYFEKYRKLFGLTGYKCYFKYEPVEAFATILINSDDRVATIRLNSKLTADDKPFKNIKRTAKHEALHLLLGSLECLARDRYSRSGELSAELESLVFKLEGLIPDEH